MKRNEQVIVVSIVLLSAVLRLAFLSSVPAGFHWDEAANGYDAYSVLLTGKDHHGNFLPILFKSLNDWKPPLHIYSIVPSIFLFGLSEFSTRLPFAVYGILTVVVTYFLVREIFNEYVALASSFLLAVSPWHIQFSRMAVTQGTLLPFFVVSGLYLFYKGLNKNEGGYVIYSSAVFSLGLYTYEIGRLFIPLLVLGIIHLNRSYIKKFKKSILLAIITSLLILTPMVIKSKLSLKSTTTARFDTVMNEYNWGRNHLISMCKICDEDDATAPTYIIRSKIFIQNYVSFYSPRLMFFRGENSLSYKGFYGVLYSFELPFIILGTILLIMRKTPVNKLILFWLFIYPIAAAITPPPPNISRALSGIPIFEIICAYGFYNFHLLWNRFTYKKQILRNSIYIIIAITVAIQIHEYLNDYFFKYPIYSANSWAYGMKEIVDYTESVKGDYDKIFITNRIGSPREEGYPYIYVLFYKKYDPQLYQKIGLPKYSSCPIVQRRPEEPIGDDMESCYSQDKKNLYVVRPYELLGIPGDIIIKNLDGSVAFKIIGIDKN